MLSWEKPLVKPMAPGVYFPSYKFPIYFYFAIYIIKNTKNIYLIISIRSHFCKWPWRDWQPLYRVGCKVLICLCRYEGFACSLLLDWYLGSQKLREILTLLCCITLSSSRKTNASSRRSKKDFWRRCRGGLRSSQDIPSTHHKPISLAFTLFSICLSFSSPPLHICCFIRPLFPNLLLSFSLAVFLFARVLVRLPCHYG